MQAGTLLDQNAYNYYISFVCVVVIASFELNMNVFLQKILLFTLLQGEIWLKASRHLSSAYPKIFNVIKLKV